MTPEAPDLIPEGLSGDRVVLFLPSGPLFPLIATAPTGKHEDAHLVCKIEEVIVFYFPFHPDGIEVQVADILELGLLPIRTAAQQHIERVAGASDQKSLPVHAKHQVITGINLGFDFANAKTD